MSAETLFENIQILLERIKNRQPIIEIKNTIFDIIENNYPLDYNDNMGNTALIFICIMCEDMSPDTEYKERKAITEIVKEMIQTGKSNPGATNNDGETALHFAAHELMYEIVTMLIATGESNPGAIDNNGETALMKACSNEWSNKSLASKVASEILTIGSDKSNLWQKDNKGNTALSIAKENGLTEVVKQIETIMKTNMETKIAMKTSLFSNLVKNNDTLSDAKYKVTSDPHLYEHVYSYLKKGGKKIKKRKSIKKITKKRKSKRKITRKK